jgi:hypothetical protein
MIGIFLNYLEKSKEELNLNSCGWMQVFKNHGVKFLVMKINKKL